MTHEEIKAWIVHAKEVACYDVAEKSLARDFQKDLTIALDIIDELLCVKAAAEAWRSWPSEHIPGIAERNDNADGVDIIDAILFGKGPGEA